MPTEIPEKIEKMKNRKAELNNSRTYSEKIRAHAEYTETNKLVRKTIRTDKRTCLDILAVGVEEAAQDGNRRTVYANTESSLEYLTSRTRQEWGLEGQRDG